MNKLLLVSIDICILTFSLLGLFTSIIILSLVCYKHRRSSINTVILLSCNTYPAIMIGSLTIIDMYAHNLYGDLYVNVSFDNWWCYLRFYFLLVALCSIYQSYLLQAFFHLFRVVFFKLKQLRNTRFIVRLIVIQWLLSFILILPSLIFNHFEYLPRHYHCQIIFENLDGLMLVAFPVYYFPMITIGLIYVSIIWYTRWKTRSMFQQRQRRSSRRDLIVLRRITLLVSLLWALSFPNTILWLLYISTGHLFPLSYHLQWLTFAISLVVLPFASAYLTPQLRKSLKNIQFQWPRSSQYQTEIIIDIHYTSRTRRLKYFWAKSKTWNLLK